MAELDEEAIRADERRRMDAAFGFELSCLGRADRLSDELRFRSEGAQEAASDIATRLRALYAETGDRAFLTGLAVAQRWLVDRPESDGDGLAASGAHTEALEAPGSPQGGDDPPE